MKKFLGSICSAVAAGLVFLFLSLDGLLSKMTMGGQTMKEGVNSWDILKEPAEVAGYDFFKVVTIVMIVLAVLLLISAVLLLLKNLNVLKIKLNLDLINKLLLTAFAVTAILCLVATFVMSNDLSLTAPGVEVKCYPGVGIWLNVVFATLAAVLAWVFSAKKKS